jgi:predicted membrane GTPase involved in stress response
VKGITITECFVQYKGTKSTLLNPGHADFGGEADVLNMADGVCLLDAFEGPMPNTFCTKKLLT